MTIKLQILIGVIAALSLGACASAQRQAALEKCGTDQACLDRIEEQALEMRRRNIQAYLEANQRIRGDRTGASDRAPNKGVSPSQE